MKLTRIVAALTVLSSGGLHAEGVPGNAFHALDVDVNGFITQDEAAYDRELRTRWNELDRDKNNLLDVSEFSAFERESGNAVRAGATPSELPTE
jgi:hypothetical protein